MTNTDNQLSNNPSNTQQLDSLFSGPDRKSSLDPDTAPGQTQSGDLLFEAQDIVVKGPWGVVFGPLSIKAPKGGVTVLKAPPGAPRTALLLALCGQMKLNSGDLTVLGYSNDFKAIYRNSGVANIDEIDDVAPSVTIRDLVTEQIRWRSHWYKWVPQASQARVEDMLGYLFQDIPIPPMDSFVADLPEIERVLVRIAIANTERPPLLVVGQFDLLPEAKTRKLLLDRLLQLGKTQSIIIGNANAGEFDHPDIHEVDVPGNLEFWQRSRTADKVASIHPTSGTNQTEEVSS